MTSGSSWSPASSAAYWANNPAKPVHRFRRSRSTDPAAKPAVHAFRRSRFTDSAAKPAVHVFGRSSFTFTFTCTFTSASAQRVSRRRAATRVPASCTGCRPVSACEWGALVQPPPRSPDRIVHGRVECKQPAFAAFRTVCIEATSVSSN